MGNTMRTACVGARVSALGLRSGFGAEPWRTLPVDGSGMFPLMPTVTLGTGFVSDKLVMIWGTAHRQVSSHVRYSTQAEQLSAMLCRR